MPRCRANDDSDWAAITAVAQEPRHRHHRDAARVGAPGRGWHRRRPGVSSEESTELKRLRRENAELRRANEILKSASAFFAAELDRPQSRS